MDAFPGLPSRLQHDPDKRDCYREDANKRGTDCATSSQHSKGSSTATSSMFSSPPETQRDVPCSSAPPPAPFVDPSPPRSSWGFGGSGRIFRETEKAEEEEEHEMVLLENDEEVESKQACGLGTFFGYFGCLSRN